MKKEYERCLRCNRKLKNPEARLNGYGSVCIEKMSVVFPPLFINKGEMQDGKGNDICNRTIAGTESKQ